ncbi:hypothetical protein Pph01_59700 [Planotetraspora phitsanulokensis]|uniref:Uncharacterized protein n=1 Tax=Planotetraspora phitsanulokensis TaxID=575192 RepID=A0A8J3UA32_9ACTN|nr:hypothetical protein Pph01_59700 [Planotetraspora phitsanulokensis]
MAADLAQYVGDMGVTAFQQGRDGGRPDGGDGAAQVFGVVDELARDDLSVVDAEEFGGGQGVGQRVHLPVDDGTDQVAIGERDLAGCGPHLWESVRHAACWPGHFRTSAPLCPWSARKGFADRASQQGELFGVEPARLISMRDAGASLVFM